MHACVARQPFENFRVLEKLPGRRLGSDCSLEFRILFDGCIKRDVQLIGDHLRDAIGIAITPTHHSPHVAHDAFRFELAKSNDLRDTAFTVLLPDVFKNFAAARLAKINVDIRRRDPVRIQKPLENQSVL